MGIKGYWKLNGNSNDTSGNGNNGTDTDVTYSQNNAVSGLAGHFNGSTSKIDLPSLGIGGRNPFSLSSWFTIASGTYNTPVLYFFGDGAGTPATSGFVMALIFQSSNNSIWIWGNNCDFHSAANTVTIGKRTKIDIVWDGGSTTNTTNFRLYLNGKQVAWTKTGIFSFNISVAPAHVIGVRWLGSIENVNIEDRSRRTVEFENSYSFDKGFF